MKKYKLFFDCCFNKLNLILLDKLNKVINFFSIPTNNNLTDISIEYLNEFLNNNHIKAHQIEKFYLTIGPGSFTGVRIGCIIGKTWCTLNENCKLYVINSLRLQVPHENGISVIDARGDKEYYALYKNNIGKVELITNEKFEIICKDNPDLPLYKNYENVDIVECLINNLNNFQEISNVSELEPIYIKDPC
ncbi:tRNA (adenosine(37)-N6)-threonylcarbamoyltransferase complex dimerization subunit type 1 TsaB [Mycoplasmoides pirum]|uniref:tRNA (adenosine(37)-N6)-threonylcarbamoyltransferase complex dimerization subunit type 1 TsaB n=1 Tax=Mycoplasmoides pirum TaxID=2122 RepID=UPI000567C16C|nr:tRNA (adenosine(37)-N6)-threonylcarbamoyltransferase complex dimerization subunit type 1 TsaB [Mycoplasmoides pirum]